MTVSEVNVTPIKAVDGLVAFASCVINGQIYIGSIGVHKMLNGFGYRITYPTKLVGSQQLNYYHPVTKYSGKLIEQAVIAKCVEVFERSGENYGRYSKTTCKNK